MDKSCLLYTSLQALARPPKLIITDSQVFKTIYEQKPKESELTSFSVLFAGYKGCLLYTSIASLERSGKGQWVVRSMNPSTTGRHLPPYAQETPLGMFVLQEKKVKMVFLKDGSKETGGYAPYASRFTDGAYIHGVPVNAPRKTQIEYSPSLGTTPRSHMCVRHATSHAKFIYDWEMCIRDRY